MIFSGLTSKPVAMVFSGLTLKLVAIVSPSLASKPVATVSPGLTSKLMVEGFLVWTSKPTTTVGDLDLKITAMVSWFWPQNQVSYGLSVAL
jgi:hypothetical protein